MNNAGGLHTLALGVECTKRSLDFPDASVLEFSKAKYGMVVL